MKTVQKKALIINILLYNKEKIRFQCKWACVNAMKWFGRRKNHIVLPLRVCSAAVWHILKTKSFLTYHLLALFNGLLVIKMELH